VGTASSGTRFAAGDSCTSGSARKAHARSDSIKWRERGEWWQKPCPVDASCRGSVAGTGTMTCGRAGRGASAGCRDPRRHVIAEALRLAQHEQHAAQRLRAVAELRRHDPHRGGGGGERAAGDA